MIQSRRFPPPWSVDDPDMKLGQECYIARDANGQALAYVFEPGRFDGTFRHLFAARRNHVRSWGMSGPLAVVAEPTLMTQSRTSRWISAAIQSPHRLSREAWAVHRC